MPDPVSDTRNATKSPRSPSSAASPLSLTGFARSVSVPPFGMASRAFTARLRMASSSSLGSTRTAHGSPGTSTLISMSPRSERRSMSLRSGSSLARSMTVGVSVCRRENVSSWRVETLAALRRGGDHVEETGLVVLAQAAAQALDAAVDDHQQIVEVMRDPAGQLADRLQPLRLAQRVLRRLPAFRFGVHASRPLERKHDDAGQQQRDRHAEHEMAGHDRAPLVLDGGGFDRRNDVDRKSRELAIAGPPLGGVDLGGHGIKTGVRFESRSRRGARSAAAARACGP